MQLEFDNYEHNYQSQVLSKILQKKTLYQVSFDSDFLGIYCLIESKVLSITAPHQTSLIAGNSRVTQTEVRKYSENTSVQKKK